MQLACIAPPVIAKFINLNGSNITVKEDALSMKIIIYKIRNSFLIVLFSLIWFFSGCLGDGGNVSSGVSNVKNNPPVAADYSFNVYQGGSVEFVLDASDADGDSLELFIHSFPEQGSLNTDNIPVVIYRPYLDASIVDTFTFYSNDGHEDSNIANVNISILPAPSSPTNLKATSISGFEIFLAWTDNSDNEDGFRIERSDGADNNFKQIYATIGNVTSFTDSGLTEGVSYYYRVYAYIEEGFSDYSNTANETPRNVVNFSEFFNSAGPTVVQISFKSLKNIAAKIEYGATAEYGNSTEADAPCKNHSFRISGLEEGNLYHYRAVSIDMIKKGIDMTFTTNDDPYADKNVYLDALVEWNPQPTGSARAGYAGIIDGNFMPIENSDRAFGPPTGNGPFSRKYDCVPVGINGSAAFRFDEGYYIFDGEGDDFKTFEGSFSWGSAIDGLCCELAHVEVSEDGVVWYYNSAEVYDINPHPTNNNGGYIYSNVEGLHGNNPTWANHEKDMQAQHIFDGFWTDIEGVFVSKDFLPTDPYLGGNAFDLSTFYSKEDYSPWLPGARMRYVRIIDDDNILDGQDYSKAWCFGAQMHAAMGIHVKKENK